MRQIRLIGLYTVRERSLLTTFDHFRYKSTQFNLRIKISLTAFNIF